VSDLTERLRAVIKYDVINDDPVEREILRAQVFEAIPEIDRLQALEKAINELRREEGDSVSIHCDNPDFDGSANSITAYGDWCNYEHGLTFVGESVLEALGKAVAARRKAETVKEKQ